MYQDIPYTEGLRSLTFPVMLTTELVAQIMTDLRDHEQPSQNACETGMNRRKGVTGCGEAVELVRVWIVEDERHKAVFGNPGSTFYCRKHGEQAAKRGKLFILSTMEEFNAYRARAIEIKHQIKEESRRFAQMRMEQHLREKEEKAHG